MCVSFVSGSFVHCRYLLITLVLVVMSTSSNGFEMRLPSQSGFERPHYLHVQKVEIAILLGQYIA